MSRESSEKYLWLTAGAAIGAALGLLCAPKSGAETRALIGSKAGEGSRELFFRSKDLYDKGRQIADEAAELFEQGRRLVEDRPLADERF